MKNILKYMKAILACLFVSLAFVACSDDDDLGSADLGLGIKVFAPTHVVAGQPMTINGSGFGDVTEIEFPGGVKVTSFERVSNEMLRFTAPAGIAAEGGKLILHNSKGETAESRLPLTLGKTVVSGFSKQEGEKVMGNEEITIYGKDLLFVNEIILHNEGDSLFSVPMQNFARITSDKLVLKVPNTIFTGVFVGIIKTFDGQSFNMPAYDYEKSEEKPEEGHWERLSLWKNDGTVAAATWSGTPYRFSSESRKTGEQVYAFPDDIWNDIIKGKEFKVDIEATAPTIRILDAWWSGPKYTENDIQVGNELLLDNGNGTMTITVNLVGLELLNTIDEKHLLFAGDGYKILEIYTEVWVDGPAEAGPVVLWEGKAVADDWGNQPFILSDAGLELADAGAKAGQVLHFFITPTEENWNLQIVEGHWGDTYVDVNQDSWDLAAHNGSVDLELTEAILQKALTQQWWGGAFLLNGDNVVCTKVTLE